jgi:glycosyltransferase involved in cell wall biosynthesis
MMKKNIKICQVASTDISLRFLLLAQMKYLQAEGFKLWAVSSDGKWIPEIEQAGISVQTIPITRRILTPFTDLRAMIRLVIFFRKERFDIVHTHTLKASFLGQIAAFLARVPVRIYTIHGLDFENPGFSKQKRYMFVGIEVFLALLVHRAFSVNKEDTEKLLRKKVYSSQKLQYFPLGINLKRFNASRFSDDFIKEKRREFAIPEDAKVLGIVARLVREKGYIELFQGFKRVLERFPNSILLVVGGEEPAKTDRLDLNVVKQYGIEPHVRFLGERTDVDELYSLFDVFVLPTYREGLGISILEASAMRRPVVATNIRGCREAVENGVTGILVPPYNCERLAHAIIELLENPEKGKRMGEAGREKVQREFDEKTFKKFLVEEYKRLMMCPAIEHRLPRS